MERPVISPDNIMHLAMGFWGSKTLLSAVELQLFTVLAEGPLECVELAGRLGIHQRSARDFFDALTALKLLVREGDRYGNTPATDIFLDKNKPSYIGGFLEIANNRLYPMWESLTEGLRTGKPQNETKGGGELFATLYADPVKLAEFLGAMTGISTGVAMAIAEKFPWKDYKTFVDIGCAQGCAPVQIVLKNMHLTGGGFDLPQVGPIFENYVKSFALEQRLRFHTGDFLIDELPTADVLVMGNILHNWNLQQKKMLLEKAYRALPNGGALIVYEWIIDNDRQENVLSLLMSLHMMMETPAGKNFTGTECCAWMHEAGFSAARVQHLLGPNSMVVGTK